MASNPSELAEHIAEYLSRDANHWPTAPPVNRPLRVAFILEDQSAWYAAPLLAAWRILLSHEYAADDGKTLALAQQYQTPDATIRLWQRRHKETNDDGLAYELAFPTVPDTWPGWFSLCED